MKLNFKLSTNFQPIPESASQVFEGKIFSIYQWQQKMYDGTFETFEKLKRVDTVGVVAVTEDNKIIVTKQEQPGCPLFYGLAGGRIDPGEDVATAALRELREEAGMEPKTLEPWFALRPSDKIDWIIYTAIAKKCRTVGDLQLDAGEKIILEALNFADFVKLTRDPLFRDREVTSKIYEAEANGLLGELEQLFFED